MENTAETQNINICIHSQQKESKCPSNALTFFENTYGDIELIGTLQA
jgi:hypothetical protein